MSKAAELAALIGSGQAQGNRNFVINGAMNVAQRSASVTGLGDGDEGYVTLDRMRHTAAASAGRFTSAQTAISDLPVFLNCLHLDCTTADTSIASSEALILEHRMEGQNLQQLKKGTSSAEAVTVSFYMKTNKAFTFMCALNDYDNNRINTQQFTTTTDWTRHSITFTGDTTGALGDDANNSLSIEFYLHAGATYTGGTYSANTWQSRASSDNMRAVGIGSFYDSTDNDIKLTGLQMEIGVATAFEHDADIGTTLAKCQRYYTIEKAGTGGSYKRLALGQCQDSTSAGFIMSLSTPLRATPTLETSGNSNHYQTYSAGAVDTLTGILLTSDSDAGTYNHNIAFNVTVSSGLVAGDATELVTNNNASYYLAFDAEL